MDFVRKGYVKARESVILEDFVAEMALRKIFDFSPVEVEEQVDPTLNEELAKIARRASQVEDEVMLCDAASALEKITQFDQEE